MTSSENKELRTCTKKGLIALINDPKYTQNKANQFPAIVGYLARYHLSSSSKEEFLDLVFTARNELLVQEARRHAEAKGDLPYDDIGGLKGMAKERVKAFLKNPVSAIASEMKNLYERQENFQAIEDPDEVQYYKDLKVSANIIGIELGVTAPTERVRYDDNPEMIDVLARLDKKMPEGDANLNASLKRINSGFFGTLFRRKSKEYSAFEKSLKTYRDPKYVIGGNTKDLEEKTTAYLAHLIPNFKYGKDMPKQQWLDALPKGKRARAEFALDVLDSIAEHREMKPYMDNVELAVKGKPIAKPVQESVIEQELKQEDFQQKLQKSTDLEPVKEEEPAVVEEKPQIIQNDLDLS